MTYVETAKAAGYYLTPRAEFVALCATDAFKAQRLSMAGVEVDTDVLAKRAQMVPGAWVLWDPCDDAEGWLLTGDDPEQLARWTCERHDL